MIDNCLTSQQTDASIQDCVLGFIVWSPSVVWPLPFSYHRLVTTCCGGQWSMKWFRPVRSTGPASWLTPPYSKGCWPGSSSRSTTFPWAGAGASSSLLRGKKFAFSYFRILWKKISTGTHFKRYFLLGNFLWFMKVNCYFLNKRINLKFLNWQKLEKLVSLSLSIKWQGSFLICNTFFKVAI